jgi:hypothetical protein
MAENNQQLPSFASLDEMVEFFDTHDMGDYLDGMPEVDFDVNIQGRTHLVAIDEEIAGRLSEIARREHVPAEALVNSWLKEKLSGYSEKT